MSWNKSILIVVLTFVASDCGTVVAQNAAQAEQEFFEKQIRPLFVERCFACHGEQKQEGGLRLTSRESILQGGDSGPAIEPGKPEASLLIRAIDYLDEPKMPPKQKLSGGEIKLLKDWVKSGAPWPNSPLPSSRESSPATGFQVTAKQRNWWAFQPVRDSAPPTVNNSAWPRNAIDHFILSELEGRGLSPAPEADRRVWLRRATFDLTGLPPTPEELDAFVSDDSTTFSDDSSVAFERAVDRLLESPAYGQRFARHWLDLVRYADFHDSEPKTRNPVCEPLEAWRYRDWVVDSFNRDLPFDQFIVHQIAGDLLAAPDGKQPYADGLVATTFLVNGAWDRGDADKEKLVSDMVDDQIDTVGKAFMGLTLGCARCHDHKFDPIAHSDYYALAGIFYSTRMLKELGTKGGEITLQRRSLVPQEVVDARNVQLARFAELTSNLAELAKQPAKNSDDTSRANLAAELERLKQELATELPVALAVSEGGTPGGLFPTIQDVPIHIRGSYTRLGPVVPRQMPTFFQGDQQTPIASGSGRRELAAWVAAKENPLTARVIVNRVWQWHFGAGLVKTPNNFGLLSEAPSHPALLDWLATRLVEEGWSLKKLHRRIVLSAAYRQRSDVPPEQIEKDPDNRWLGRFAARRLEAEAIRDAMLFVSGKLDPAVGGPASDNVAIARRSLYVQTARWDRSNFATLFDAANPDASEERRNVSTVAPQSLFLLNNAFALEQAKLLAERLLRDVPSDMPDAEPRRIQRAYLLLFGRNPTEEEWAIGRSVVAQAEREPVAAWADLAHVLLCCNEFIYLD